MIKELDTVALTVNIPEHRLKIGDVGVVVMVYNNGETFEIEFVATDGSTIALERLTPDQIRHTYGKKEIMHIRELA